MSSDPEITIGGREIDPIRGGLLLLVIGLAVVGYGLYDYTQQSDAVANAVEVEATITDTDIRTVSTSNGIGYRPTVRFDYEFQGESYTSEGIYPASISLNYDSRSQARSIIDDYQVDQTVTAYVDPESPSTAFLRDETSNSPLVVVAIGVVFFLAGGSSLFKSLRAA